jgi:hypothetical protein
VRTEGVSEPVCVAELVAEEEEEEEVACVPLP